MMRSLIVCCLASITSIASNGAFADRYAIIGGTVHTLGSQGTLQNGQVLVEDGKIAAVGVDIRIPDGTRRIDASGKVITPGLFDPVGQLGLTEVSAEESTVDFIQRGDRISASFDVADAFNPQSTLIAVNRIEGVTRALIAPASSGVDAAGAHSRIFSGLGSVVDLGVDDEFLVARAAALVVNLGSVGSQFSGGSRAAAMQELRTALTDAKEYAQHRDAYNDGARREYSLSQADLEALQDVLAGQRPMLVYVQRASDITVLIRLARDFGIRLIIVGGAEAWMVADELAAASVPVILRPMNNLPSSFDALNSRLDAAAILRSAGVSIVIGEAGTHNSRNMTQAAGNAVANGLSWLDGLRAITLAPAQLYGLGHKLGSIEPWKDADLVIWDGDPLEVTSYPDMVIVEGVMMPMQSRQSLLRDRYLQTDSGMPPAYR